MPDKKIIKIKRSAKKQTAIPTLSELKSGLDEHIIQQSIDATMSHLRAALSNNMKSTDIPFYVNQASDYELMDKVIGKLREAGYDIEMIKKEPQTQKLPDGQELSRTIITNRYHLVDRKTLNKEQASEVLQSFERIKKVIGENK